MRSILAAMLALAASLLAIGCGSGRTLGGGPTATAVTLSRDVQPVFTDKCAFVGCHGGSSPTLGMNLGEGQAHANTVNVPSEEVPELMRVKPGDSANSYLFIKISQDNPPVGDRMPLIGDLSATEIDLIRRWIDGGALP